MTIGWAACTSALLLCNDDDDDDDGDDYDDYDDDGQPAPVLCC